jgi:hypothetical protein
MRRNGLLLRLVAGLLMCLGLQPVSLAANGSLVGTVKVREGAPSGVMHVRATPVRGGVPTVAPVENGAYRFDEIAEGPYRISLLDSAGTEIGDPVLVVVAGGVNSLDLVTELPAPTVSPQARAEDRSRAKSRGRVWAIAGGAGAALLLVVSGNNDDGPASAYLP